MRQGFLHNDAVLTRRLKENDKSAFELIFNNFSRRLYCFTLGYVHSQAEAEEIIQNVFISLWENRDMLNEAFPLHNYLYKVTINHIYNYFKQQSVRRNYRERVLLEGSEADLEVEQSILANDLEETVNRFVEDLPLRQQIIYRLSRMEGLCHAEIAQRMGLSIRAVENHIYRTLKYIREKLQEESLLAE